MTPIGSAGRQTMDTELRVLSPGECWLRLHTQRLGRISFVFGERIEIFPVNFGIAEEKIVVRTGVGTKLHAADGAENIEGGLPAVFEVDFYDDRPGVGWSVVARGGLVPLSPAEARWIRQSGVAVRPVAPGERLDWLAIEVNEITGRSFNAGSMTPYWVVRVGRRALVGARGVPVEAGAA